MQMSPPQSQKLNEIVLFSFLILDRHHTSSLFLLCLPFSLCLQQESPFYRKDLQCPKGGLSWTEEQPVSHSCFSWFSKPLGHVKELWPSALLPSYIFTRKVP